MSIPKSIENVRYVGTQHLNQNKSKKSITIYGLDTEAYRCGKCFMIATSEGDIWHYRQYPDILFSRKYRGCNFVVFNLSYDAGALLQFLPKSKLLELWSLGKTIYDGYHITSIPKKMLSIRKKKNTVHFYDIGSFYPGSLSYNAKKYLGDDKVEIETVRFTIKYVRDNWDKIGEYCAHDALLTKQLAQRIIAQFEDFGVYPKKLYSTAYVSFQYFRNTTKFPTVYNLWHKNRAVLDYAMRSYNGGKFEVTKKGIGYFYEYDISSAYPYEIARLVDISKAGIVKDTKYRKDACYGFLLCKIYIPLDIYSPVAIKIRNVCYYAVDEYEKVITIEEYRYLILVGCDITIIQGYYLMCDKRIKPFKNEIKNLFKYKQQYKKQGKKLEYHTIKIFLNSFYGKMVQLIDRGNYWQASNCWNPIYGAIITANVRIRITQLQQQYDSIWAVHTDSVISTKQIPSKKKGNLGDLLYECEGEGCILGCGIYQVGEKSKFRGFDTKRPMMELIDTNKPKVSIPTHRPLSWREAAFRGVDTSKVNRFMDFDKKIRPDMDHKRLWLEDWKTFKDVMKHTVESLPFPYKLLF